MNNFELHNRASVTLYKILSLQLILFVFPFIFFVGPKAYDLYKHSPDSLEVKMLFQIFALLFIGFLISLLFVYATFAGKKIIIQDSLVYFMKKTNAGFGKWVIERIINFSKVVSIRSKEKRVYAGKTTITSYWLIFDMKNGHSEEMLINGWDFDEIKKLFYYLKGKYPKMILNNFLITDTSEEIAGLKDLVQHHKP